MQELSLPESVIFEGSCSAKHSIVTIALFHSDEFEACAGEFEEFILFHLRLNIPPSVHDVDGKTAVFVDIFRQFQPFTNAETDLHMKSTT